MAGNCQTPLSMEFSRQEYWSRWLFPSPRDLRDPRIEPRSPVFQADSSLSEPAGKPNIMVLWHLIEIVLNFTSQAPLAMGFSRQEYKSGSPFLSPGDIPDPGIKPGCPALQADSSLTEL